MNSWFFSGMFRSIKFHHVLFVVSVLAGGWGLLQAQDDGGGPPPSEMSAVPMHDESTAAADAGPPAPSQDQPAPDQAKEFTSDDATGATQGDASFQTFYDALSDQGTWVQSNDYGYVWQPQVSDPNWAPYTQGHWAYTDDGWAWVSDENFGWATYHYGRWANLDGYGWVWVPGYTWAPAWVSWRYGDGYAGWAPLPPDSFVGVDYSDSASSDDFGYHIGGDADNYYGIGVGCYIFLPIGYLCNRDYHGHYCDRHDNWHLIGHTSNVTNINVSHHHGGGGNVAHNGEGRGHRVTAGGPQLAQVNAASSTPMQKVTLAHTSQRGGGTLNGNTLAFYAPRVHTPASGTTQQPSHVTGSIAQARINHGTDILKPLAVNSHLTPPAATQAQVDQARLATSQISPEAKAMTDTSSVRPVLQRPLSTMRPVNTPTRSTTAGGTLSAPPSFPGATRSAPATASSTYSPAGASSYAPASSEARSSMTVPDRPGATYMPAPASTSAQSFAPNRIYPQTEDNVSGARRSYAPASVYSANPSSQSYMPPAREAAPTRTYNPATAYPPGAIEPRSSPMQAGGGAPVESRTYTRPSAAAAPTESPRSAPSEYRGAAASAPVSSSVAPAATISVPSGSGAVAPSVSPATGGRTH